MDPPTPRISASISCHGFPFVRWVRQVLLPKDSPHLHSPQLGYLLQPQLLQSHVPGLSETSSRRDRFNSVGVRPTSPRGDPQRDERVTFAVEREKKQNEMLGLPPFGPPPFEAPTLRPTLRPHRWGTPTFLGPDFPWVLAPGSSPLVRSLGSLPGGTDFFGVGRCQNLFCFWRAVARQKKKRIRSSGAPAKAAAEAAAEAVQQSAKKATAKYQKQQQEQQQRSKSSSKSSKSSKSKQQRSKAAAGA